MLVKKTINFFYNIQEKPFLKNLSMVIGGTALSQLITVACTPIVVRQYGADAIGLFGIFMAITGVLATLATGRYNLAIMLPKNSRDSALLVQLCFMVATAVALGIALMLVLVGLPVLALLNAEELAQYMWFFPIVVLVLGFKQTLEQWLGRHKYFAIISLALLVSSLINNGFKIALGFFSALPVWLILGSFLAFLVQVGMMVHRSKNLAPLLPFSTVEWHNLKKLALTYGYLPLFRAPKDFINSITYNAPVLFLATFFGAVQVGLFTLAERILRLPGQVVGDAVRKVLYQKIAESYNNGSNITALLLTSTGGMAALSAFPFGLVIAFGPELFAYIFGEEWRVAGDYGVWLAVAMFFNFVAIPSVVAIPVLKLEKLFFSYEIAYVAIQLSALFYGGYVLGDVYYAIALYCISGALLKAILPLLVCAISISHTNNKMDGENE